jgi:hypothetical protein
VLDHPTTDSVEREPLPFSPSAPGCAFSVHERAGQWGSCGGRPAVTGIWTCARNRQRWRAYACAAHADRFDGPEWHNVGPLDEAATAELHDRRERWADALAGKGWRPPQPLR